MKKSKRIKQYIYLTGGIFFLIVILCLFKQKPKEFYNNSDKVWAHRGLSISCTENSMESTNLAFEDGFSGVEMDIWYNKKLDLFEVKHDKSIKTSLYLNNVLEKFNKPNHRFWLDLKNISNSNEKNIISLLESLNNKYKIKERVIIETPKAKSLKKIKNAGFFTSLYLKPIGNVPIINDIKNNSINILNMCFYNFNAISLPADSYVGLYRFLYKRNNVHLWKFTKKRQELKRWEDLPEVKIILFDGEL